MLFRFLLFAVFLNLIPAAHAFDAVEFWREPQIPFDQTAIEQGRDRVGTGVEWRSFVFTSEIYGGAPMRVFAIYARPAAPGKYPAVVSLHGGIDRANRQRAIAFARAGYACLAFDWLPDTQKTGEGASIWSRTVYTNVGYSDWGRTFSDLGADGKHPVIYRAVIAARRALTWLGQQNEVDATRLAVEGHSWGGFLAQLLAGVDPRVKAVVSSAAAGSWQRRYVEAPRNAPQADLEPHAALPPTLPQTSISDSPVADEYFTGASDAIFTGHRFSELTAGQMFEWSRRYDPAAYAQTISAPILVRLGASDFFGSVDGLADYWNQISAPKALQLLPAGNHTFSDVETRVAWFDYWLKGLPRALSPGMKTGPFPEIAGWKLTKNGDGSWTVTVQSAGVRAVAGQVAWSTSPGASVTRQWAQRPLAQNGDVWTATFTPRNGGGPLRVFASLKDAAGHVASVLPQVTGGSTATGGAARPLTNSAPVPIARIAATPPENPVDWNRATEIGPVALSPEMVGERSAALRALWDENALYLRVKVADATPWQPIGANQAWWNADSVHLRFAAPANGENAARSVFNLVLYNDGQRAHPMAFRGVDIKEPVWDMTPLTTRIEVEKAGYTLTLRLPWSWLGESFAPRTSRTFRFAFLANDSDLLTDETILGANFNNAHALYKPEVWGVATLEG